MAHWLPRLLRHRMLDEQDARRLLGLDALKRIEARVAASEKRHSGEIRVVVEAGLPLSYLRRKATPRDRAVALFGKLGVWDTERNNGVLVYLLLAERAIEIVADRGLDRHVPASEWAQVAASMQSAFQARDFEGGLLRAIDAVDALLVRHFAARPGDVDVNELPDAPLLR
ncbi:MAG: TPM domain-containing protein [Pseudomonadota bacterium]|nr:TPM domain-containing protein [Pseudomonadota bacterium]